MELTTRAQALEKPLSEALANLNGLLKSREFEPGKAQGRFRLALSDYAARIVLPGLVRHVRQHAPGIDLAISQASREAMLVQLADGELDLALGIFPNASFGIHTQDLFEEGFISIADKRVLPASGELSLEDWLQRPHIMLALRPDANDEIEKALAARGLSRRIAVALPHWTLAVELLTGTDLVLTVARRVVGPMTRHSSLHRFSPPLALPRFPYQQAWHTRRDSDPAHRWLRQVVLTCSEG